MISNKPENSTVVRAPLILIADDAPDVLEVVSMSLRMNNFRVAAVASAEELINAVNELCEAGECPDMIISDVNFFDSRPRSAPKLTGFSAARAINERFPNLPILFLTAYANRLTRENAIDAGGAGVMSKPFIPSELVARVEDVLRYRVPKYEGRERRQDVVNLTGQARRRTDRRVMVSETVAKALTQAGGE